MTVHPFPARMAPDIALSALGEGAVSGQQKTVLDPMCGSGTVVNAALRAGHLGIGLDIDPLAILMTRVAASHVPAETLNAAAKICLDTARAQSNPVPPPWADKETGAFAEYWFGEKQIDQLSNLTQRIRLVDDQATREALQVALSRIIVTKTPQASLAADTAHSRPHKVQSSSDYDVYRGFERSVARVSKLTDRAPAPGRLILHHEDARTSDSIAPESIDLTITSPPYLNAIDYLRGHRLSLIWLGFEVRQLRAVRRAAIGSEVGLRIDADDEDVLLEGAIDLLGLEPIRPLLRRYVRDVRQLASQLLSWTRAGGSVITVVADSTHKGRVVATTKIVEACLASVGFSIDTMHVRDIPADKRYLPVNKAGQSLEARMKQEVVLHAKKAAA